MPMQPPVRCFRADRIRGYKSFSGPDICRARMLRFLDSSGDLLMHPVTLRTYTEKSFLQSVELPTQEVCASIVPVPVRTFPYSVQDLGFSMVPWYESLLDAFFDGSEPSLLKLVHQGSCDSLQT